jgi:hypothetical protein
MRLGQQSTHSPIPPAQRENPDAKPEKDLTVSYEKPASMPA